MSEKEKRGPKDYNPHSLKRASILRTAMESDLVTLVHTRDRNGKEVDVLCIKDMIHGSLHPMAIMLDSIDDIESPPGTTSISNIYLN